MSETKSLKRYVRTVSGSIWELGPDGKYHIPNCATVVSPDDESIVDAADEIFLLVKVGDVVHIKSFEEFDMVITEKDIQREIDGTSTGHISSYLLFDAVYTPEPNNEHGFSTGFQLVAFKKNNLWFLK